MPTAVPFSSPLVSFGRSAVRCRLHQSVLLVVAFDCVLELLPIEERPVPAAGREEVLVSTLFYDLTVLEHDDPAGIAYGTDAMGGDERRASRQCRPERMKDLRFGMGVHC